MTKQEESNYCKQCFHDNFNDNPLDDLEAACGCDCHEVDWSDDE